MSFETVRLEQYLSFKNGKTSPERYHAGKYPVYGSNGVIGYSDKANADEHSLIIGRVGSYCGSVYFSETKCWVTDNAIIGASLNKEDAYFWFIVLTYLNLNHLSSGSGQPLLNQRILKSVKAKVSLDLNKRVHIGNFLKSFSQKIEKNNQINETLEAMAQAIFKSWFVDFDPVKAKVSAREAGLDEDAINRAAMRVIASKTDSELMQMAKDSPAEYTNLQTTASHFPDELVESELGLIPKGWEVSSLGVLCEKVESGGTPKRSESEYWEGDIPWLSSGETHNIIITETREKITQNGLENSSAKLWTMYTTIVAMYGATAGKVCFSTIELTANQACCGLIPKEEYEFFLFFTAKNLMSSLAGRASGSAQQNLNKSLVEGHECLLPNEILVKFFNRTASSLIEKWIFNLNQNKNLLELRDSLLPKLLSGEIEV